MQPTPSDVHVDAVLTEMSKGYFQPDGNFIGTAAFGGPVPVKKQSDKYFVYSKDAFLRDEMKKRAPATESEGSGYGVTTDNYACDVFALHKDVSDEERANTDNPLDADADAVAFLAHKANLNLDVSWAGAFFATGKWATDVTPGVLWSTYATSDPHLDIETGKKTVLAATGFEPNTLILGYEVFSVLKNHPDLAERIKYTSSESVTPEIMAKLFDVDRVLVARSVKATAEEGAASQTYGLIHGKHALLAYVSPQPRLRTITAGVTMMWTGISQGLGANAAISRFRMAELRADRIEIEMAYAHKVVASDCGYFFNGAVA